MDAIYEYMMDEYRIDATKMQSDFDPKTPLIISEDINILENGWIKTQ